VQLIDDCNRKLLVMRELVRMAQQVDRHDDKALAAHLRAQTMI
jgi:hypothetical protein